MGDLAFRHLKRAGTAGPIVNPVGDILGGLLGVLLGDRFLRWRSSRHAANGEFDCALRAEGRGWEHGRARVSPGLLEFRRMGVYAPERDGRRIAVEWASPEGRRPSGREGSGITSRATIFRIRTSEGPLDWAVAAPSPEVAVGLVQPTL